jgi:hypothetical protein
MANVRHSIQESKHEFWRLGGCELGVVSLHIVLACANCWSFVIIMWALQSIVHAPGGYPRSPHTRTAVGYESIPPIRTTKHQYTKHPLWLCDFALRH